MANLAKKKIKKKKRLPPLESRFTFEDQAMAAGDSKAKAPLSFPFTLIILE